MLIRAGEPDLECTCDQHDIDALSKTAGWVEALQAQVHQQG